MHWKSLSARSRIRWPSNCPGLLQKVAGTVVLVLSSHSTSHLILQSQARVLPRRSLPGTPPSHHPSTQPRTSRASPPEPRAPACHPVPSTVSWGCHPVPSPGGVPDASPALQVAQDVQRLEEVPGQGLQVVVGQGAVGQEGLWGVAGGEEGARTIPVPPGYVGPLPRYSQMGQGLEPTESALGESLDVIVLDEPGAGGDGDTATARAQGPGTDPHPPHALPGVTPMPMPPVPMPRTGTGDVRGQQRHCPRSERTCWS